MPDADYQPTPPDARAGAVPPPGDTPAPADESELNPFAPPVGTASPAPVPVTPVPVTPMPAAPVSTDPATSGSVGPWGQPDATTAAWGTPPVPAQPASPQGWEPPPRPQPQYPTDAQYPDAQYPDAQYPDAQYPEAQHSDAQHGHGVPPIKPPDSTITVPDMPGSSSPTSGPPASASDAFASNSGAAGSSPSGAPASGASPFGAPAFGAPAFGAPAFGGQTSDPPSFSPGAPISGPPVAASPTSVPPAFDTGPYEPPSFETPSYEVPFGTPQSSSPPAGFTGGDPYPDPVTPQGDQLNPFAPRPTSPVQLNPYGLPDTREPRIAPSPPRRRRTGLWIGIAVAVVVLLGGGATVFALQGGGGGKPAVTNTAIGPISSSAPLSTPTPDHPGQEPPVPTAWPAAWPRFAASDNVRTYAGLDGLGFTVKVPQSWQCTSGGRAQGFAQYECGVATKGTQIGGEVTVRDCPKPCSAGERATMRKVEEAWSLRWQQISPYATFAESSTLQIDGHTSYGLVIVAFWRGTEDGTLDHELVLRMTAPPQGAGQIRRVANYIRDTLIF